MTKSSGSPPDKRQKTSAPAAGKNAFEIMFQSSKLCWPSSGKMPSAIPILEIVAKNGWFPWQDGEEARQNPDYSILRLLSRGMKKFMDEPAHGGPDFESIVFFLELKNGFDDKEDMGFCDHCYSHGGEGCDTCIEEGDNYECCECKKDHRYGATLVQLDPRLNPDIKFKSLAPRKRAVLLLQFLRTVTSNFLVEYYQKWDIVGFDPDLTVIDPDMVYLTDVFCSELEKYNEPFYNFIHHLLFTGWADNDTFGQPGSCSPYRGRLLGDGEHYNAWNGGHNEHFFEIFQCFVGLHKSNEAKTVPVGDRHPRYTVSQVQYVPETIRRCVKNTVDDEAVSMLGKPIADSIDIYRLVRETYNARKDELSCVKWMPCLGVRAEDFVPLHDFEAFNPEHERDNIDATGLLWK